MATHYPIAFSFDDNLLVPAQVTLSSLFATAPPDVTYDVYLTYSSSTLKPESIKAIEQLIAAYPGNDFTPLDVGQAFNDCFEIRDITVPTYYRLLLPELLPKVDKIIYSDVDIVFARSPHQAYHWIKDQNLLCGVKNVYRNADEPYLQKIGVPKGEYINAGFIVMNLSKMRENALCSKFVEMSKTDYIFQDQDILNITCQGSINQLPLRYNVHAMHDYAKDAENFDKDRKELLEATVIHYAGVKPWNNIGCFYYDQWWEAYRHSPVYDFDYYLARQKNSVQQVSQLQFDARNAWAHMKHLSKFQRLKSIFKPSFWT